MTWMLLDVQYCDRPICYRIVFVRDFSTGSSPSQSYHNIDIEEYDIHKVWAMEAEEIIDR